jgi:hypothetical protein
MVHDKEEQSGCNLGAEPLQIAKVGIMFISCVTFKDSKEKSIIMLLVENSIKPNGL